MRAKFVSVTLFMVLFINACGQPTSTVVPPTVIPTDTPVPTATIIPTPSTPMALLVIPADMDQASSDLYQKTVYDLAEQSGYRFQVRNTLTPEDLADSTLKVVIAFPPDPGIATLAPAVPNVQFLAVNIPNLTAGGNVSVLAPNSQVDVPAFLAGYVAAMVTDDYHIGMIIPQGDAAAMQAFYAFSNGMSYYCGLCRTFYISQYSYPQYVEIPPDEEPNRYGGYANVLINDRKVYTLYVYPSLATDDFLTYIGTVGGLMIGTSMPDPRPAGWIMTITPDMVKAIQSAWPNLVGGQGGLTIQSPLTISDVDPTLLTPGRQRLAQQVLDGLVSGEIITGNP